MGDNVSYRLEVPRKIWEKYKQYLRKVYWQEELNVSDGIIKLMEKFIKENE